MQKLSIQISTQIIKTIRYNYFSKETRLLMPCTINCISKN